MPRRNRAPEPLHPQDFTPLEHRLWWEWRAATGTPARKRSGAGVAPHDTTTTTTHLPPRLSVA